MGSYFTGSLISLQQYQEWYWIYSYYIAQLMQPLVNLITDASSNGKIVQLKYVRDKINVYSIYWTYIVCR